MDYTCIVCGKGPEAGPMTAPEDDQPDTERTEPLAWRHLSHLPKVGDRRVVR